MWEYDNSEIRRQDRKMPEERARALLENSEYGILSVNGRDYAYGVPLNYAISGNRIYIHCAPEGKKLELIRSNDRVSFCVVGKTRVRPSEFTATYESVIIRGKASVITGDPEKTEALVLIREKYSPSHAQTGNKYIEALKSRTSVIKIDMNKVSGKSNKPH